MIESLGHVVSTQQPVVVMDAGIATAENLSLIRKKGYHYLCVSRTKLKDYKIDLSRPEVELRTNANKKIKLQKILTAENTEYIFEVKSPLKAKKEEGMKSRFEKELEEELERIKAGLNKKGGIKRADKVNQRIGRAKQKYPSAQGRYEINLTLDEAKEKVLSMDWKKNEIKELEAEQSLGKYFLKTSLETKDESIVWSIYNTIREIESTFRTLKTDLDLRPIYHKKDESSMAHLNLGLLAYWLVNTIRQQ